MSFWMFHFFYLTYKYIGITFASFNCEGMTPDIIEQLKTWLRGSAIVLIIFLVRGAPRTLVIQKYYKPRKM